MRAADRQPHRRRSRNGLGRTQSRSPRANLELERTRRRHVTARPSATDPATSALPIGAPAPTPQVDVGLTDQVTVAPPQIGGIPLESAAAGGLASRFGDAPADPAQVGSRTRPSHARTRTRASDGRPYDAGLATSWAGHSSTPSARAWSSGAHAAGLPPRARAQAPLRSPATRVAGGVARSKRDDEPE